MASLSFSRREESYPPDEWLLTASVSQESPRLACDTIAEAESMATLLVLGQNNMCDYNTHQVVPCSRRHVWFLKNPSAWTHGNHLQKPISAPNCGIRSKGLACPVGHSFRYFEQVEPEVTSAKRSFVRLTIVSPTRSRHHDSCSCNEHKTTRTRGNS